MTRLADEKCRHVPAGAPPLSRHEVARLARHVPDWGIADRCLRRQFSFQDFRHAMAFVNCVAQVADDQDHHPDIHISYDKVRIELSTHSVGGLSMNDFIMAAKIDQLLE